MWRGQLRNRKWMVSTVRLRTLSVPSTSRTLSPLGGVFPSSSIMSCCRVGLADRSWFCQNRVQGFKKRESVLPYTAV